MIVAALLAKIAEPLATIVPALSHATVAAHLSGLPGRKAVLYLGGRVPTQAGLELFEAWRRAFGRFSDRATPTQPAGVRRSERRATASRAVNTVDVLVRKAVEQGGLDMIAGGVEVDV